jgi:hypothetical protein
VFVFNIDIEDMSSSLFRVGSVCAIHAWGNNFIANISPLAGADLTRTDKSLKGKPKSAHDYNKDKYSMPSRWSNK